jgi:hypothetical protein
MSSRDVGVEPRAATILISFQRDAVLRLIPIAAYGIHSVHARLHELCAYLTCSLPGYTCRGF